MFSIRRPLRDEYNATAKEHQEYLRKGVCNVLLACQCLDRRIGTQQRLEEEALCWEAKRNAVIRTLTKKLGPQGFHFILPHDPVGEEDLDDGEGK